MKQLIAIFVLCATAAFAAVATPTAITSVAVAGSTVTVTATAHGLAVNQGFCITASSVSADNVCGVVATSAANSFTFSMSGLSACAATCGTSAPAKQIVSLDVGQPVDGNYTVNYLCWLTTQTPVPGHPSAWAGASTAENNALTAGNFIERGRSRQMPIGTTLAQFKSYVQSDCGALQSALAASAQPGFLYGDYFDGVGWSF